MRDYFSDLKERHKAEKDNGEGNYLIKTERNDSDNNGKIEFCSGIQSMDDRIFHFEFKSFEEVYSR